MTATHTIPTEASSVEGLPKSFVYSMRTLFDIMDDQHTGFVRFTEIERRWQEDGTQGLPRGVLSSLRKVTPPNGFLSFDRFCAGLKMCLLKNKGKDEPVPSMLSSIRSLSALSPTNSLEVIAPLKASSPQTSPQHQSPNLLPPPSDQEFYLNQQLNGMGGNRNPSSSSYASSKQEKNNHYHSTNHHKKPVHSSNHSRNHNHNPSQSTIDSKIYAAKSDIRMGIGGIKGISKCPSNNTQTVSSSSSTGPPKPPRAQDGGPGDGFPLPPGRHYPTDPRMTNSLERESRSDRRWNKTREPLPNGNGPRRERGGSLERLLDAGSHHPSKESTYGPPLNRTGMRSALQSWFKERSKSDLQQGDTNNNYHNHANRTSHNHTNHSHANPNHTNKRYNDNFYKESRVPPGYSATMETGFRGTGDGGDSHRSSNSGSKTPFIGRGGPPPPPVPAHGRIIPPPPPVSTHTSHTNTNHNENKVYSKPMETVVAVPTHYSHGGRNENASHHPTTNGGVTAHGLYVAPQPPQVAVHKKTSKKKEPRRHTLQNGVDQNVMKRLRQLEAERDMLYQGLDVVDRAKAWYKGQLQGITERIHYLPLGPPQSEPSIESQQEKLHFQLARIHEINAHLRALMDASDGGLPAHMNLAIRGAFSNFESSADKDRTLDRLKQQNKLLTEEVSGKSERISGLEREKAALLRELFQARATHRSSNADSTFM